MKRLVLILLTFTAAPALAEPVVATAPAPQLPVTLSIDSETQWHLDRGYRLFGTKRTDTLGGVSASVEVLRLGRGTLAVGAGYHYNGNSGVWAGQNDAQLDEYTPSLSALLRWSPYRWLEPHLRVAADVTRAKLRLTLGSGGVLEDELWAPGGSAGAGLRLRTGTLMTGLNGGKLGVAGALIIEGGYRLGMPYSFDVAAPPPGDEKVANDRIPAASTSVGELGRAQPYLRVSFALLI